MAKNTSTPVCIIGAGPAGATLSLFLSKLKIEHIIIDKSLFPRDKICGDGITLDVMHQLWLLDSKVLEEFVASADLLPSHGFCFHAPNGKEMRFDFQNSPFNYPPFYTAKRLDLDNFLVEKLPSPYCDLRLGQKVVGAERTKDGITVKVVDDQGEEYEIKSQFSVGAEGEKPILSKSLGLEHYREKKHLIGAIRNYHKNVEGFHEGNHLEFFFNKDLLPGYFWIFPLQNGEANIGCGMVSTGISKEKVNLKKIFDQTIQNHPRVAEMMRNAEPIEKIKGWGLPTITKARKIAGERYALIGDAGGTIEPFTGKGIGPGMLSARLLSDHLNTALRANTTDLSAYEDHIYRYYSGEIKTGYALQKSLKYPWALNLLGNLVNTKIVHNWAHRTMEKAWAPWIH